MNYIQKKYDTLCRTPSDINEHLPTLFKYATDCESIIELGVRGCISSWALVNGLLYNNKVKKQILLNDIKPCDINELLIATSNIDIEVTYKWINDLQLDIVHNYDMTFIDTWHVYGQLKRELDKYSKITNKYIVMHDTTIDGIVGETIRNRWNAEQQSKDTGFTVDEINSGLQKAIDEFLVSNKNWVLKESFTNNNGLTVLERLS
jgi:hypothetical protein